MIWPSKKVLSVFIITAALVASVIIAFGRDKSSQVINSVNNLVAGEKVSIPENTNWRYELENAQLESNLTKTEEADPTKETATTPETVTDVISRTFMSNYLSLKQGGDLNQTSAQELINKTLKYLESTQKQEVIGENQLNIIVDNGAQTIIDYGENLGNITKNKKLTEIKNEIEIVTAIAGLGDLSRAGELDNIISIYETIKEKLLKMPVPKTFVKAHLAILNGVGGVATALKEMRNSADDPFRGLAILESYQKSMTMVSQAAQAVIWFLNKNNIIYKQGSGGYYLLYGI